MDDTEKIIKEYFDGLPESFKKAIGAFDWQKKVTELGQKYTLSNIQIEDLSYEVLFVLVGIENDTNLSKNIQQNLGISTLVSDEISIEIQQKIFDVIIDFANKEDNKKIEAVTRSPIPKVIVPQKTTDLPLETTPKYGAARLEDLSNVVPDNLPVSDEDKKIIHPEISIPRYIPTKVEEVKAEEDKKYEDLKQYTATEMQGGAEPVSRINYKPAGMLYSNPTPQPTVEQTKTTEPQEFIQKPQSVPRLNFNNEPSQNTQAPKNSSIESRWDNAFKEPNIPEPQSYEPSNIVREPVKPTTPESENKPVPPKTPSPSNPIVKSYTVDPYREPIE